jgi:hypothetical protein
MHRYFVHAYLRTARSKLGSTAPLECYVEECDSNDEWSLPLVRSEAEIQGIKLFNNEVLVVP